MSAEARKDKGWLAQEISHWGLNLLLRNKTGRKVVSKILGIDEAPLPAHPIQLTYIYALVGLAILGLGAFAFMTSSSGAVSVTLTLIAVFAAIIVLYAAAYYVLNYAPHLSLWGEWVTAAAVAAFGVGLFMINNAMNLHIHPYYLYFLWAIFTLPLAVLLRSGVLLALASLLSLCWMLDFRALYDSTTLWYPLLVVVILLPLTYWIESWAALAANLLAIGVWFVAAATANFGKAAFFMPFTITLYSTVLLGMAHLHNRNEEWSPLRRVYFDGGIILLCAGLFFLAMHAFGAEMAKAWLETPKWLLTDGKLVLILNVLLSLGAIVLYIKAARDKEKEKDFKLELSTIIVLLAAVWIYFVVPEKLPESLKESILTPIFFVYPLVYNLLLFAVTAVILKIANARIDGFAQVIAALTLVLAGLMRYFDRFWIELPRPTMMALAGLILLTFALSLRKKNSGAMA